MRRATTSHTPLPAGPLYALPERCGPRAEHVPAGRSLHIVDVENLMGGPLAGDAAMRDTLERYRREAPLLPGDHVIVGVNPALAFVAADCWPGSRLVTGGGPNGADRALLQAVGDIEWCASRYDRVVIGSGDGAFEDVAAGLAALGIPVVVVSRRRSLSYSLQQIATLVRLLDPTLEASA